MPAGRGSQSPDEPVVQQLLAERRDLKVTAERLRLELAELRGRIGKPDPRLRTLEAENGRLREELEMARAERDHLRKGVGEAVQKLGLEIKRAPR